MTQPFNLLFLVLTIGLIARLTRFLVDDTLTAVVRRRVYEKSAPGGTFQAIETDPLSKRVTKQQWIENPHKLRHKLYGFLAKVLDCAWCASIWVAAEVTSIASYCVHQGGGALTAYWYIAAAGTASLATGVLTTWLYSREDA